MEDSVPLEKKYSSSGVVSWVELACVLRFKRQRGQNSRGGTPRWVLGIPHQWFLTWLSVLPGSSLAISDQRFPSSALASDMMRSSSALQAFFLMEGSGYCRWMVWPSWVRYSIWDNAVSIASEMLLTRKNYKPSNLCAT